MRRHRDEGRGYLTGATRVNGEAPNKFPSHRKGTQVVVAMLLTAAVSGFFMGLQQGGSTLRRDPAKGSTETEESQPTASGVPRAASYSQLPSVNYKANARWENHLKKLVQPSGPDGSTAHPPDAPADLAERRNRRAFDGAPPLIPHPVDPISPASCLACHGQATRIKDRVAPKMSHALMQNCTQCHVTAGGLGLSLQKINGHGLAESEFEGLASYGKGARAFAGAPPLVPHPTWMRSDCLSCHGPAGASPLSTSHPERVNCLQCHATAAGLEQRLFLSDDEMKGASP